MLLNLLAILLIITLIPAIFYVYWYAALVTFFFMYRLGGLEELPVAQGLANKLVYHFRSFFVVYAILEIIIYYYDLYQPLTSTTGG